MNPEVRGADYLEIVGQAGMRHCEIVFRQICRFSILVDERRVRIVDDLAVPMVLHHDHKYMIQARNALGNRTLSGE